MARHYRTRRPQWISTEKPKLNWMNRKALGQTRGLAVDHPGHRTVHAEPLPAAS